MIYLFQEIDSDYVRIVHSDASLKSTVGYAERHTPRKLELVALYKGDKKIKEIIHFLFRQHHVRGDWFVVSNDLLNLGKSIITNLISQKDISTFTFPKKKQHRVFILCEEIINNKKFIPSMIDKFSGSSRRREKFTEFRSKYNHTLFGTSNIGRYKKSLILLELLNSGLNKVQICKKLNITSHTINDIIKKCYLHENNKYVMKNKTFDTGIFLQEIYHIFEVNFNISDKVEITDPGLLSLQQSALGGVKSNNLTMIEN